MIKKIITIVSMLALSITLVWAVWEGNAASGSQEEFPSGLFAASDLFPKHTLIEIVNLEQNTRSRAVIVDNIPSDGLLVKLSPDLAAALAVRAGNIVRVRVSVPPLVAEEGADPMLLTKEDDARSGSPSSVAQESFKISPIKRENTAVQEPEQDEPSIAQAIPPQEVSVPVQPTPQQKPEIAAPFEVEEPEPPVKTEAIIAAAPSEVNEPVQPVPADQAVIQPVNEASAPVPPAKEEQPADAFEPVRDAAVSSSAEEPFEESVEPVSEVSIPEKQTALTQKNEEPVPEAAVPMAPTVALLGDQPVKEVDPIQEPVAEDEEAEEELYDRYDSIPEYLDTPEDNEAVEADEVVEEDEAVIEEPEQEAEPEPVLAEDEQIIEEAKPEPLIAQAEVPDEGGVPEPVEEAEPVIAESEEAETQQERGEVEPDAAPPVPIEQHVMLVPAEPRAPVGEVPVVPEKTYKPEPLAALPVVKEQPPVAQPAKEAYTSDTLQKGSFYVQVGRFTDALNVEGFVQRYGKQYPIAVEKSSTASGGSFYRVYIGPLKKDEQGAALETFRQFGFKDAFLKKVP